MRKLSDAVITLLFLAASASLASCAWYVSELAWGMSAKSEEKARPCRCAKPCCPCEPAPEGD